MNASLLYTDEGLRVLLAEDNFIYVVNESDDLIYVYACEDWPEWLEVAPNFDEPPVSALIPFAHHYQPSPLAKSSCDYCQARGVDDQMTLREWEVEHQAAVSK